MQTPNQTPEQTLQTLAHLHPDYPTFAKNFPTNILPTTNPLPEGLAADVLTLIKKESPELASFIDAPQASQPTKFFPGAETVLPLVAILFLLRSHIEIKLPGVTIVQPPMGDKLVEKIIDMLGKYMGGK